MQFKYLYSFFKTFKIQVCFSVVSDFKGMVRYHFLYAAVESGLLEALKTPYSRDDLINKLGVKNLDILDALLNVGISLKELNFKNDLYGIRGKRSQAMIGAYGDTLSAVIQAMQNIKKWGLAERFEIIKGDIRDLPDALPRFDLITLVNLVYYFPVEQRTELFRALRSRLALGGRRAIKMNMQGKNADFGAANLNMANASMQGVTPLPDSATLQEQLKESGFSTVRVSDLMPGSSFVGMQAI